MKRIQLTAAYLTVLVSVALSVTPAWAAPPSAQAALRFLPHSSGEPGGGTRIDVFLDSARGVAGYELVATVNGSVATLTGADSRSAQTENAGFHDVSISGQEDAAVLAAYSPSGSTLSGQVRLGSFYIDSIRPGVIQARIGAVRIVGADGSILSVAGQGGSLISVGTGSTAAAAPATRWRLPSAASSAASQVRRPNPELELSWQTLRLSKQPCDAAVLGMDVTGDGCLDVGDLVVNGRAGNGRTPTTQTPLTAAQTPQSQPGPTAVPGATASGAVFIVNSVSDESDQNVGNGICRTASGACSLRAAIQEANSTAGPNEVDFAIPGSDVHTIQLLKNLPALNDASGGTFVNGYSQPGSAPNTDPVVDNAQLMIEIRGKGATSFDALPITSAYNTVRGLSMYNSRRELWIYGTGATHNTVAGNFIGTDASGTFITPAIELDAMGIKIEQDAPDNTVGGPSPADRNVVSGNGRQGIALWHNKTDRTVVQNNIVGLSPDGTRRIPNRKHGIDLNFGASESQIGGTGPGERNVVSGNDDDGVEISHTALTANNTVSGNYIGSDVTGNAGSAITANANAGIYVEDGVTANVIANNVIVNNTLGGVVIVNGGVNGASTGNIFRDNRIGVGRQGARLGNGAFGVTVNGTRNTIGPNNLIQFNNGPGVQVTQTDAIANKITRNVIADNQGLSIDLSPVGQANPNDPGDADTGANAKLNYPEPFRAGNGQINGRSCVGCTIEIYVTGTAVGNGPARTYGGSALVDSAGSFVYASSAPAGTSFSAVAIDASGNTSEMAPNVTMQDANAAPTIDAGSDVSVNEGGSTRLEATTADPDGTTGRVAWDLDEDGIFETSGTAVTFSAAGITAPAEITVTARVTDAGGLTATDTLIVTVRPGPTENVAPTARLVVPSEVLAGSTVTLKFDQANDSASDLSAGLQYAFDCGGGFGAASSTATRTCQAGAGPTAVLKARVLDQAGAFNEYAATVVVYPNLLLNSGFEAGGTWPNSWTSSASLQWVTAPVHSGTRAVSSTVSRPSTAVMSQRYSSIERTRYRLSGYVDVGDAGSGSVTLQLRWYNAAGAALSTVEAGRAASPTNGFVELSKSFVSPSTATAAKVEVVWNTTGRAIAVDDLVLRRDNQLQNGEFDLDQNGDGFPDSWVTESRFTRSSSQSHLGTYSGKSTGDGGSFTPGQRFDQVIPGARYVVTGWLNVPSTAGASQLTVRLRWLDASAGTTISAPVVATLTAATPGWIQVSGMYVAPAGAVYGRLEFAFSTGFTSTAYIDSVVVAKV